MSDAIELLSAIGQNAALRYASAEELAHTLEQADASEAFKAAVISGDSSRLSEELGQKPMHVDHHTQIPGHEEDEPDHDDDDDDPDHDDDDDATHPPKPAHGKPSPRR